ncbi:traB domain-containing protein-like [Dioscorea cayenensis subsp. rotundata]|uniref:TraB domain-containing protein-like n=1 Tax=Dioscorea cayennensis subsp. rotundata TaxID=55577 RepID=A0AB40BV03_DIOCR|nr:traB domain-containing protein-like [Dioscorea cayenensis subsp. rotundata]
MIRSTRLLKSAELRILQNSSLPRRRRLSHTTLIPINTPQESFSNLLLSSFAFPQSREQRFPTAMAGEDDVHATTDPDLASSITTEDVSGAEDPRSSHGLDPEVSPDPHSEPEKVSERSTVRRGLPEELSKGVVVLECESSAEGGSCDVYIVGTAHVSLESCREVQTVINYLKPQVVFLELCSSRVTILTPQNLKVPTMSEMIDMWKKKKMNTFGILYSWFLAKVANKLEVFPGSEFRVAYEEAMGYGAKVVLGDRPVHITLRRSWGKMTLWHRTKFLYYMLFQAMFLPSSEELNKMLKEMDDVDMLTLVIQEMSKAFPTLMETLIHERDMYMASILLKVASEHSSIVAVVGKGHLAGIKKHWKQPLDVKHLLEVPPRNTGESKTKILTSLGVVVAGIAVISGIYLVSKR